MGLRLRRGWHKNAFWPGDYFMCIYYKNSFIKIAEQEKKEDETYDYLSYRSVNPQVVGVISTSKINGTYQFEWDEGNTFLPKTREQCVNKNEPYSEESKKKHISREQGVSQLRWNENIILLILESPHICEYCIVEGGEYENPAMGTTGLKIYEHLPSSLNNLMLNLKTEGLYYVALIEAVPFQCSLGKPTKTHRDKVFEECWEQFGENLFKKQFKRIITDSSIIINACTSSGKEPLCDKVQMAIDSIFENNSFLRSAHPSYWWKDSKIYTKEEWNNYKG